jgi:glutathione S-transferase
MADLRVFSYLPNPRLYKATIAARYSGATVEIVGGPMGELQNWLWDYDARELTGDDREALSAFARQAKTGFDGALYKTDDFLAAHPFGAVPAGFAESGTVGFFESNSIMRAAARLGPDGGAILGNGPLEQTRIDSFLDRALVFARNSQRYLLAGRKGMTPELHGETGVALGAWLGGLENALSATDYVAGPTLTLADISFACEIASFSNEVRMAEVLNSAGLAPLLPGLADYKAVYRHLSRLARTPEFAADLSNYFERLPLA